VVAHATWIVLVAYSAFDYLVAKKKRQQDGEVVELVDCWVCSLSSLRLRLFLRNDGLSKPSIHSQPHEEHHYPQ